MRSESDVKAIICSYLEATVPARCAAISATTQLEVPAPALWAPYPARAPGVDEWPAVFVSCLGRAYHRQVDTDAPDDDGAGGDETYVVGYRFTVELWCLVDEHHDYGGVDDLRGRLVQAIVAVLIDKTGLQDGRPSLLESHDVDVDVSTITSRNSDVFEDESGRQAGQTEIEFVVDSIETLRRDPLAEPEPPDAPLDITVDVELLEDP